MNEERELLEQVWVELSSLKDLISVCEKGMEESATEEGVRACSVLHEVGRLIGENISPLDDYLKCH